MCNKVKGRADTEAAVELGVESKQANALTRAAAAEAVRRLETVHADPGGVIKRLTGPSQQICGLSQRHLLNQVVFQLLHSAQILLSSASHRCSRSCWSELLRHKQTNRLTHEGPQPQTFLFCFFLVAATSTFLK